MNFSDLENLRLTEDILVLLEDRPLDDVIDAMAGAFRRRATDLRTDDAGDCYLSTARELEALKERDFELSDLAAEMVTIH